MAGDAKKLQPIIVKRIKKGGHGAHGGAWKIAYADFVTAMMAFFLLMWLLGSTTEGDRKGLQDYFNSPLKVAMSGGSGSGDSSSVIKGGARTSPAPPARSSAARWKPQAHLQPAGPQGRAGPGRGGQADGTAEQPAGAHRRQREVQGPELAAQDGHDP
jgi:flagellar motor protein MotB